MFYRFKHRYSVSEILDECVQCQDISWGILLCGKQSCSGGCAKRQVVKRWQTWYLQVPKLFCWCVTQTYCGNTVTVQILFVIYGDPIHWSGIGWIESSSSVPYTDLSQRCWSLSCFRLCEFATEGSGWKICITSAITVKGFATVWDVKYCDPMWSSWLCSLSVRHELQFSTKFSDVSGENVLHQYTLKMGGEFCSEISETL